MVFITLSAEKIIYKKIYLKTHSIQDKSCYTKCRNKLNSLIKVAKKKYLSYKEKCNIKDTWKLINSLLNKSQPKHNPSYFVHDNMEVRGHRNIADTFNDYFVNIGSNIANQLPTPVI